MPSLCSRTAAVVGGAVFLACSLAGPGGARASVVLEFDYTLDSNGFFTDPTRRTTLETAGRVFTERFLDNLTAITPGGSNNWTATINHPATGASFPISNPTIPANTVRVYAGGRDLPGSNLGIGGPGGFNVSGTQDFVNTVVARGQPGALLATETDFGLWGGSITFDTVGQNWNFGAGNPTGTQVDFFSTAVHELAHLFGFGTADSWKNLAVGGTQFTGPRSVAAFGGPVPVSNGHWASGTQSTVGGVAQEAAMDPSILVGTRKKFTVLDFAGMDDMGWDLARPGDANADGRVDSNDFVRLASAFGRSGQSWATADFNYDGRVDTADFTLLASNFGRTGPDGTAGVAAAGAGFGVASADWNVLASSRDAAAVPEPATAGLVIAAGGLLMRRRRRRA